MPAVGSCRTRAGNLSFRWRIFVKLVIFDYPPAKGLSSVGGWKAEACGGVNLFPYSLEIIDATSLVSTALLLGFHRNIGRGHS